MTAAATWDEAEKSCMNLDSAYQRNPVLFGMADYTEASTIQQLTYNFHSKYSHVVDA
jgi:hypothetical protein